MKERDIRTSYEGFQSERHETTQTMQDNLDNFQLRGLVREFHVKFPVQTLLTHFKQIFNQKGFKTTEVFPGKIMIVRLSFIDRLKFILSSKQPRRYLLTVKTQEYKSVRKVLIRKLHDHPNAGNDKDFEEIKELFEWIDSNPAKAPELRKQQSDDQFDASSSEYQQDMYSLEATSTYMYHKIFVDRNYSMGRKMNRLIQLSKDQLHESSNAVAAVIIGGINEINEDMLKGFNCTRKQLLEILCHCRKSVQDFYHDRNFILKPKDRIEEQRRQIDKQVIQKVPQTIKCFEQLVEQRNSQKILLQIFKTNYILTIECQIKGISESEKAMLAKKIGKIFAKEIHIKTRTLDLWGYPSAFYHQYLHDFIT